MNVMEEPVDFIEVNPLCHKAKGTDISFLLNKAHFVRPPINDATRRDAMDRTVTHGHERGMNEVIPS